ncbi:hypothetical protein BST81_23750 [Leptolyngbya sp. 'hensonii']|uniref:hypothetical protein n=1 Tax=Leptolyngbya sp. 'hensonii' TaxID=1922337 RepID=UPI00094F6502|nr:hypothetical protein [Leptolyngbya sp. 'hensonii']OLP15942.1 hypothetical protein BST81_23750 [Leptolyngbya sp. 'hensonii']
MFDDVIRKLKRLEHGVQVSIQLELDDNGYLDRVCPSNECKTHFKVFFQDWRDIVRDEEVFCPLCRHDAKATEWNTPKQDEYIKNSAYAYVQQQLGEAFQSDARRFNRSQNRNSFIKMSMSYKPGSVSIPIPASATEVMTQEFQCDECKCRYSSIGAAFFCPSCGHNSVLETFSNSLQTVKETLAAIPVIRTALEESTNKNVAEDSIRHICENGLVKIVSSFQRYAEACFQKLPNSGSFSIRRNLFQSLSESDAIWRSATGTGYTDILDSTEYQSLLVYFQQRHVLSHLDGIVDQQYIDRSNDCRFDVGQRLIVTESGVVQLATVIEKLANGLVALT